ncbi:DUF1289 domain-containing protein [Massilia sp. MB5]|uniref:DUF1289 domain-containing protein n=1 Tax=unclassified Massilia TaxID=2609279 RepID=UPI0035A2EE5E
MQANSGRTLKMRTQDKIRLISPTTAPMSHDLPPGAPELATPVPSPCISLCKMNRDSGFCEGCLRTIDEIVAWSQADDAFKRGVWAEIRRREQLIDFE